MKEIALIAIMLFFALSSSGQSRYKRIEIKKGLGVQFIQGNNILTPKKLHYAVRNNKEANEEMKKARIFNGFGVGLGVTGGALVGFPIGTVLFGGKPNWIMAGAGAILVVTGLAFSVDYTKHAKKAVNLYNDNYSSTKHVLAPIDLAVGSETNWVTFSITF